jgi:hypothetical protein
MTPKTAIKGIIENIAILSGNKECRTQMQTVHKIRKPVDEDSKYGKMFVAIFLAPNSCSKTKNAHLKTNKIKIITAKTKNIFR